MSVFGFIKSDRDSSEYEVFVLICILSIVVAIINLLLDFIFSTTTVDLIVDSVGFLFFVTIYLLTSYKRDHQPFIYPTLFFLFLMSPAYWLQIGYINVTGALIFIGALLVSIFIAPRKSRKMIVLGFYALAVVFTIADVIYDHQNDLVNYDIYRSHFYFLLIISAMGYIAFSLKKNLDTERESIRDFSKSLNELSKLSINEELSLNSIFVHYLGAGCKFLHTDKALITKKEWNKWRVIEQTGFDNEPDVDLFTVDYEKRLAHYEAPVMAKDASFSLLGSQVGSFIVVPILVRGDFYGHLIFFWPFSNQQLRDFDLESAEVISQYLGYVIGVEHSRGAERQTREALSLSETRFRKIFENANVGIAVADLNGNFVMVNPSFREMIGYSEEEFLQMNFSDITYRDDLEIENVEYNKLIKGEISGYQVEKRNVRKDGSIIQILVTVSLIHDTRGKPRYGIGIIEDITRRKMNELKIHELNIELEEYIRRLESTNKELESFSYSVSHDLRAPLRAINGFSKILEDEYGPQIDEEGRRLINIVANNATKMGSLIDDLLSFSKLSRQAKNLEKVSLNELLDSILNDLAVQYDTEKIVEIEQSLPSIFADKNLLRQALINIISNALKFSAVRDQPKVHIRANGDSKITRISISDNGVGFDMKYQNKLFKVFQRLHSEKEFSGTGVGLAIVERIIKRHGGKVWAESEPGVGATFHVEIPKKPVRY